MMRSLGLVLLIPLLTVCSIWNPDTGLHPVLSAPLELYVSPGGSDSNPGSPDAPLRSLSAAAAKVRPGSTVHIAEGTYHEQLITQTGGTPGHPITFRSSGGEAVIDGSKLPWKVGGDQNQGLIELRHPHVRLVGLTIMQSKNSGIILDADHLTVQDCDISMIQRHGISTATGRQTAADGSMIRDILLEGNDVHRTVLKGSGFGQAISLIADGFVIRGNRVHHNQREGIDVWLGSRHGEVVGNEVHDNLAPGIYVDGAAFLRIHRNRIYANSNGGIGVSSEDPRYRTSDVWVYNNLIFDHPKGDGCFVWDPDTGAENVIFAHNTLVGNKTSFAFSGRGNTVEVINNLGHSATGTDTADWSVGSQIRLQNNAWINTTRGFVDARNQDFRLKAHSPGIDTGILMSAFEDDRGGVFRIDGDFEAQSRPRGKGPDLGAFESH